MKLFFIGIKGSGMTSLASVVKDLGYDVSGSDVEEQFFTEFKGSVAENYVAQSLKKISFWLPQRLSQNLLQQHFIISLTFFYALL